MRSVKEAIPSVASKRFIVSWVLLLDTSPTSVLAQPRTGPFILAI